MHIYMHIDIHFVYIYIFMCIYLYICIHICVHVWGLASLVVGSSPSSACCRGLWGASALGAVVERDLLCSG